MPKIFVLRDRLAEQQARLRANDKNGGGASVNGSGASEDAAAGPSQQQQQQQQPLNLQSRPQYAPKIGKNKKNSELMSQAGNLAGSWLKVNL